MVGVVGVVFGIGGFCCVDFCCGVGVFVFGV